MTHSPLPAEDGLMEKISDLIGSVRGIFLLAAIETLYIVVGTVFGFDAYPFPFLTLVLSLIALQFSQVIIVVQNRQGAVIEGKAVVERKQVADDFEIDRKVHALVASIHEHVVGPVAPVLESIESSSVSTSPAPPNMG